MCRYQHFQEQIVELFKMIPQKRVSERILKQVLDVPVPQFLEEIMKVLQLVPQKRYHERIVEQFVYIHQRTVEEIANVPVPVFSGADC